MVKHTANTLQKMESLGLRTLTLTFKDLEPKDVIPNGDGGAAGGEELAKLEKDLVLVAACGIKDPLRKDVPEAVRKCQVSLYLFKYVYTCIGLSLYTYMYVCINIFMYTCMYIMAAYGIKDPLRKKVP